MSTLPVATQVAAIDEHFSTIITLAGQQGVKNILMLGVQKSPKIWTHPRLGSPKEYKKILDSFPTGSLKRFWTHFGLGIPKEVQKNMTNFGLIFD